MGGRLSLESRFPSFEEAIDVADEMRQRRHARGKTLAMRAIAALLIVAAIFIGGFPAMLQYRSARDLSGTSVRSVRLPIYHGTSESALASGAGHLYGSSLPVGGKSTHAVLTGHRGLVEAAMFTRLDEMRVGDYFYIEVMGRTFGYQVDRITVIEPNDTSQLKIVPGEDRVTLMTCTPYGVNTLRLLVSATRSAIPDEIPAENDAVTDARAIGAITGIATLVVGALLVWLRRKPWHIRRHAAWWPKRG